MSGLHLLHINSMMLPLLTVAAAAAASSVMLSAGFCHLLADALRQLAFIGRFPIATFLAAVGYLITLLADQIVTAITAEPGSHHASNPADHKYVRLDADHHLSGNEAIEMVEHPATAAGGAFGRKGRCDNGISLLSLGVDDRQPALPQQQQPALPHSRPRVAVSTAAGGTHELDHTQIDDLATCIFASSSPRAITAGSTHPRPSVAAAAMANGLQQHCTLASCPSLPADSHDDQSSSQPDRPGPRAVDHPDQGGKAEGIAAAAAAAAAKDAAICHDCGDVGCTIPQHKQQQQQQWRRLAGQQQTGCSTPKLACLQAAAKAAPPPYHHHHHHHQQQQQANGFAQHHSSQPLQAWEMDEDSNWATGAFLETTPGSSNAHNAQLSRSQSGMNPSCCCSCHRHGAAASRPEGMTEARSVAKAAEHLELDMPGRAGAAGAGTGANGHNHAHFQVRPVETWSGFRFECWPGAPSLTVVDCQPGAVW
jgi:hypothetical protein